MSKSLDFLPGPMGFLVILFMFGFFDSNDKPKETVDIISDMGDTVTIPINTEDTVGYEDFIRLVTDDPTINIDYDSTMWVTFQDTIPLYEDNTYVIVYGKNKKGNKVAYIRKKLVYTYPYKYWVDNPKNNYWEDRK